MRGAQVIGQLWPIVQERGALNQRSDWYAVLRTAQAKGWDVSSLCMAGAIVDLCYNYTIAESIQGLTETSGTKNCFGRISFSGCRRTGRMASRASISFLNRTVPLRRLHRPQAACRVGIQRPGWSGMPQVGIRRKRTLPQKAEKEAGGDYIALSLCRQIIIALFYGLLFLLVSRLLELPEDLFPNLGAQAM